MSRVFVINQPHERPNLPAYDVSPASQYGEIIFLFRADQPAPSADPGWATRHAYRVLRNFSADDFLVWAGGDPLGAVIAASVAADVTDGKLKYLKWERARNRTGERTGGGYYVPLVLDIAE
jgi:hypothetical protein